MIQRSPSSPNQALLRRPRLHSLIRDGLKRPLLVMLAGPGYGKTQAMTAYLAESGADALWLHLTSLDNLPTHFWRRVVDCFKPKYPDVSQSLRSLGFPDSLSSFAAFVRLLLENCTDRKQVILVFDDFGAIDNEQIKTFFRRLVDAELENFPLVLMSSELGRTDSIAFLSRRRFLILAQDLRFTRSETAELYKLYKLPLTPDELDNIERHTEGWAMALSLLAQHRALSHDPGIPDEIAVTHMFEEQFFAAYSRRQQLMLVKLSLLSHFTRELAIDLYDGNPVELEELGNHAFLTKEPVTGRYFFHHLYHLFLENKQYLLSGEDKRSTWKKAAEYYSAVGHVMEAITCRRQCGDHAGMLKAISIIAEKMDGVIEKEAEYLLEHLDLLTPPEVAEYLSADYLRARIYISILELEKAERLLLDLEKRLLDRRRPEEAAIIGDVYVALGFIHMMRIQEDFGDFFQKAAGYLPKGSSFYDRNTLALGNNNCFALPDNRPGARERMEQAAFKAAPWLTKVLCGSMSGMEYIISAESALMVCDFDRARQQAHRGICKAETNGQHDYVLNGYFVMARIGFLTGDLAEMSKPMQSVVEYAATYKVAILEEIRDTLLTWYYMKLRDFNRIPKSIITADYLKRPLTAYGRMQIAYASYLTSTGEYARMVAMLEQSRGLFLADGIWHDRICLFLLLAIGHHHLGNPDAAMNAFWRAYDMCRLNGANELFIETGDYLLPLMCLAGMQGRYEFSREWLDSVYSQTQSFVERAEAVRAEYRKQNPVRTRKGNPLSKRERQVLQALAGGLTREEIALRQYISVNTVKAAIRSIYNKLAANNRAEAVSIAIACGYIDGYMPE